MIPGFLISIVTFPGVIAHELAHKVFCDLTGTRVVKVCYFRFGNPAGYVLHEQPTTVWRHMLIGIGPFIGNSLVGFFIGIFASRDMLSAGGLDTLGAILTWLGVSIAMHSFPSTGDAKGIWRAIWAKDTPITAKLVGTPLVGIILLGALGSVVWLDLVYGVAITLGLPKMIFG